MEETVKDRLLQFLKAERISKSDFARQMGLSPAYVGAMRKSMPEEKVSRVMELYPRLSRDWLLYGEGSMYGDNAGGCPAKVEEDLSGYIVPVLPVEAYAGGLQNWSQGVCLDDCDRMVSPIRGVDFAIRVTGDSMEPFVYNGMMVLIRRINERAFIPWGHPMVIDTENGVVLKVVKPSGLGNDYIEAESYNRNYPPFDIPKESIYGLYRVMGTINEMVTL